jgi:hypothetical protein
MTWFNDLGRMPWKLDHPPKWSACTDKIRDSRKNVSHLLPV